MSVNPENLEVKIKLDEGRCFDKNLGEELKITPGNLDQELMEHAGKYAWWGVLCALAEEKAEKVERTLAAYRAELDVAIRRNTYEDLPTGLPPKITETTIASIIETDEAYIQLKDQAVEAKRERNVLRVARAAFEQRKDMLQSYASNRRVEYKDASNDVPKEQ